MACGVGAEVANMSPGAEAILLPRTQCSERGVDQLDAWHPGPRSAE